ncbi:hypothetical protein CMZ84_10560 [Lysobacteraceae bacterium NML93-0399]|nr:hypothetical protein CMZ84_10560 [Xanthomonadaceae bacterium NML93-0399]
MNWMRCFMQSAKIPGLLFLTGFCTVFAVATSAQDPSSPDYHRVFLPAHGVGDTRQITGRRVWGASAVSEPDSSGVSLSGFSVGFEHEQDARDAAITMCRQRGGNACTVELAFANNCAVVAASDSKSSIRQARPLRRARKAALAACGRDCRVLHEGCALP